MYDGSLLWLMTWLYPSLLERGLHSTLQGPFHKQSKHLQHTAADFHKNKLSKTEQVGSHNTFYYLGSEMNCHCLHSLLYEAVVTAYSPQFMGQDSVFPFWKNSLWMSFKTSAQSSEKPCVQEEGTTS